MSTERNQRVIRPPRQSGAADPGQMTANTPANRSLAVLTHDIHPDATTNARLLMDVARVMVQRGWRVTVYSSGASPQGRKTGPAPDEIGGVHIRRFYSPHFNRRSVPGRLANGAAVAAGIFSRLAFQQPSVVLADTTSPFLGPVAWALKRLKGVPYVYVATELYPDAAVALGYVKPGGLVVRVWDFSNRRVYGGASHVIVIGEKLRHIVERQMPGGIDDPRLHVIHNWADVNKIRPIPAAENWFRTTHGLQDKTVVLYSGNMGLSHDLKTVIEAAALVLDEPRLKFVLIGEGPKKATLERMVHERRLGNVLFLPYQPAEGLPYSLSCGDLSVVTLGKGMDRLTIPSKLYPAMAAGQAILTLMGQDTDTGAMTEGLGIGVRVDQGDAAGLAATLKQVAANPGVLTVMKAKAREVVEKNYSLDASTSRYAELIEHAQP